MKKLLIILLLLSNTCYSQVKIKGTIFDLDTYVLVNSDTTKSLKIIRSFGLTANGSDLDSRGSTFYEYGLPIVVWFPTKPKGNDWSLIVTHESFHVIVGILQWAGLSLSDETEELYAFMLGYYTNEITKILK